MSRFMALSDVPLWSDASVSVSDLVTLENSVNVNGQHRPRCLTLIQNFQRLQVQLPAMRIIHDAPTRCWDNAASTCWWRIEFEFVDLVQGAAFIKWLGRAISPYDCGDVDGRKMQLEFCSSTPFVQSLESRLRINDTLKGALNGMIVTPCGSLHLHNTENNRNEIFMTVTNAILDEESPMVKPAGRHSEEEDGEEGDMNIINLN